MSAAAVDRRCRQRDPLNGPQQQLVVDHLALVERAVNVEFRSRPETPAYSREDALQDAYLALARASQDFDPAVGASFSTFAWYRVSGAIVDGFRKIDPVSRTDRARIKAGERCREDGSAILVEVCSLSDTVPGTTFTWEDVTADRAAPERERLGPDVVGEIARLLGKLPERERYIVRRVIFEEAVMREVGVELGVSESRVSQLLTKALTRLRPPIRKLAEAT